MIELDSGVKFVFEVLSIYRVPTLASARGVPSLDHEILDDSVKHSVGVVALHAELDKISHSLQIITLSFKLLKRPVSSQSLDDDSVGRPSEPSSSTTQECSATPKCAEKQSACLPWALLLAIIRYLCLPRRF